MATPSDKQTQSTLTWRWIKRIFWLLLLAALLWQSARLSLRNGLDKLAEEGQVQLNLYVAYLQGVLDKYKTLPELLATNKRLVDALSRPGGGHETINALNQYLETINRISDASDTYVMDSEGLTIAASNWQAEHPFVGRNFSFRPYFQQAMQNHLGRYFALGTTSGQRGYYFAYPVRSGEHILGAVVIKIDIELVEKDWNNESHQFLVTDPDGVIFIASNPQWLFSTLRPLDDAVRERIEHTRRYPNASLDPLPVRSVKAIERGEILDIDPANGVGRRGSFLRTSQSMSDAGWEVHILSDTHPAEIQAFNSVALIASGSGLLFMVSLLLRQRRKTLLERQRFEQESRERLRRANEQLESRVNERTRELTDTNTRLVDEVEERRRAEKALKQAQAELIQAAKLATLGQMSASINHELNQPLAAIRAYADNSRQFLELGKLDEVSANLGQISDLTERMAQIGAQLKVFSRKTSGELSPVGVHSVVDAASRIVAPALRKAAVDYSIDIHPLDLTARGNDVLLQQVLVNLLGNAVQAIDGRAVRQIKLRAYRQDEDVFIEVADSGPGISDENRPHIFEPFFTTKDAGKGLGLGLTISYRILREMGGDIRLVPVEQGALFEIQLPLAETSRPE